jgi:hypothetical protein
MIQDNGKLFHVRFSPSGAAPTEKYGILNGVPALRSSGYGYLSSNVMVQKRLVWTET